MDLPKSAIAARQGTGSLTPLHQELGRRQQLHPALPVLGVRHRLGTHPQEVIGQSSLVEVLVEGSRNRAKLGAKPATPLLQTRKLFGARLTALTPGAEVIGEVIVMPHRVHRVTGLNRHHGDLSAGARVGHFLHMRDEWRAHLIPRNRQNPFIDRVPHHPADRAVVFNAQQDSTTTEVTQRDELLREVVGLDIVALKLDTAVLALTEQRGQLGQCHHRQNP